MNNAVINVITGENKIEKAKSIPVAEALMKFGLILVFLILSSCSSDGGGGSSESSYPSASLVIPDSDAGKVISVNTIKPGPVVWREFTGADIGSDSYGFKPSDIFIDNMDNIYVSSTGNGLSGIFSISSIDSPSKQMIIDGYAVDAFTIDTVYGIYYYTLNDYIGKVFKAPMNGSGPDSAVAGIEMLPGYRDNKFNGMCLDDDSHLYLAYEPAGPGASSGFCRISLTDGSLLGSYTLPSGQCAKDITILNGKIYGSVFEQRGGSPVFDYKNNRIICFDASLNVIQEISSSNISDKHFYGPSRFLPADDSRWLYVIDENTMVPFSDENKYLMNRIVAIDTRREEDFVIFNPSEAVPEHDPFYFYMHC